MRRHAFRFVAIFLLLVAATLTLQELMPQWQLRLLPAASEFIPAFLVQKPPAPLPTQTAEAVFDNRDKGLANFYRKLAQLKNGRRERVRVMHFGDSVIWYERVARDIRAGLIRDFGDGGRGQIVMHQDWGVSHFGHQNLTKDNFEFLTVPYNHFNHIDPKWLPDVGFSSWTYRSVKTGQLSEQRALPSAQPFTQLTVIARPARDTAEMTEMVRVANYEKNPPEVQVSSFGLNKGGCTSHTIHFPPTRHVAVGFGAETGSSLNAQPAVRGGVNMMTTPVIAKKETTNSRSALIDAALLETDRGVSYSTFVHKGKHMAWMTAIEPLTFECGYKAAAPDLLIFQYGINEGASIDWKAYDFSHDYYRKQMREFFGRIRKALPETDILIIGPYDRLKKVGDRWVTYTAHDDVRRMQREMAREMGFAFYDSFTFLGGAGHMERMTREGLATGDYSHLNDKGSAMLGTQIYRELYAGFAGKAVTAAETSAPSVSKKTSGAVETSAPSASKKTSGAAETSAPSPILFNSFTFAYFFIIVFAVAAFLNRIPFARLVFLTLVSWYFYASWRYWALGLMLFSTGIDYIAAIYIERSLDSRKARARLWLLVSLISNLGLLFFFKYYDFFAGLINPFLGRGNFAQIPVLELILPVGISFYTFQSLSYTIDVYRRHMPAEKSFWRFAFFVAFFPQLVAGPIVRATDFIPQIMDSIRHFLPSRSDFGSAVYLFAKGLFKKTLADWISVNLADRVFSDPAMFTSAETLFGVYAFGIQIYLDFSSYTDMAIAAARVMGFNLTINFNRPYVALTITEFWRRWHISLSTWLRDYLYISLGGNRKRLYLNLLLTMLLGGLWHGAGINFVLWGALHGLVLVIERVTGYAAFFARIPQRTGFFYSLGEKFVWFITFHLVMFSWIFFRCHDFATFVAVMDSFRSLTFAAPNIDWKILTAISLPYLWQWMPEKFHFLLQFMFSYFPATVQAFAAYIACLATYRIYTAELKTFIYFQF
ncbi:MAG: MBOAT family O-acyltransferase [Turneriella sp.]